MKQTKKIGIIILLLIIIEFIPKSPVQKLETKIPTSAVQYNCDSRILNETSIFVANSSITSDIELNQLIRYPTITNLADNYGEMTLWNATDTFTSTYDSMDYCDWSYAESATFCELTTGAGATGSVVESNYGHTDTRRFLDNNMPNNNEIHQTYFNFPSAPNTLNSEFSFEFLCHASATTTGIDLGWWLIGTSTENIMLTIQYASSAPTLYYKSSGGTLTSLKTLTYDGWTHIRVRQLTLTTYSIWVDDTYKGNFALTYTAGSIGDYFEWFKYESNAATTIDVSIDCIDVSFATHYFIDRNQFVKGKGIFNNLYPGIYQFQTTARGPADIYYSSVESFTINILDKTSTELDSICFSNKTYYTLNKTDIVINDLISTGFESDVSAELMLFNSTFFQKETVDISNFADGENYLTFSQYSGGSYIPQVQYNVVMKDSHYSRHIYDPQTRTAGFLKWTGNANEISCWFNIEDNSGDIEINLNSVTQLKLTNEGTLSLYHGTTYLDTIEWNTWIYLMIKTTSSSFQIYINNELIADITTGNLDIEYLQFYSSSSNTADFYVDAVDSDLNPQYIPNLNTFRNITQVIQDVEIGEYSYKFQFNASNDFLYTDTEYINVIQLEYESNSKFISESSKTTKWNICNTNLVENITNFWITNATSNYYNKIDYSTENYVIYQHKIDGSPSTFTKISCPEELINFYTPPVLNNKFYVCNFENRAINHTIEQNITIQRISGISDIEIYCIDTTQLTNFDFSDMELCGIVSDIAGQQLIDLDPKGNSFVFQVIMSHTGEIGCIEDGYVPVLKSRFQKMINDTNGLRFSSDIQESIELLRVVNLSRRDILSIDLENFGMLEIKLNNQTIGSFQGEKEFFYESDQDYLNANLTISFLSDPERDLKINSIEIYNISSSIANLSIAPYSSEMVYIDSGIRSILIYENEKIVSMNMVVFNLSNNIIIYQVGSLQTNTFSLFDSNYNLVNSERCYIQVQYVRNDIEIEEIISTNEFITDYNSIVNFTIYDKVFNQLIANISKISNSIHNIILSMNRLTIRNNMKEQTTIAINETISENLLVGSEMQFILPDAIYNISYINDNYPRMNISNLIVFSQNMAIQLNTTYHSVYFAPFGVDFLGIEWSSIRFYINGGLRSFGINQIRGDYCNIVVKDFFNSIIINETIYVANITEYNIYVPVVLLEITNYYDFPCLIKISREGLTEHIFNQTIGTQQSLPFRFLANYNYSISFYSEIDGKFLESQTVRLTEYRHLSFGFAELEIPVAPEEVKDPVYIVEFITTQLVFVIGIAFILIIAIKIKSNSEIKKRKNLENYMEDRF